VNSGDFFTRAEFFTLADFFARTGFFERMDVLLWNLGVQSKWGAQPGRGDGSL
jgi:hypothetical protein